MDQSPSGIADHREKSATSELLQIGHKKSSGKRAGQAARRRPISPSGVYISER